MATYVAGDIQGCFEPLQKLLDQVEFAPGRDRLWFAGDLVNRGPDNLGVLRLAMNLGESAVCVLGNHDIHLLGRVFGLRKPNRKDTLQDVLDAPDRDQLIEWLRRQPVLHTEGPYALSHAGIPHTWTVDEAKARARELEAALQGPAPARTLDGLFGNQPSRWQGELTGQARLRAITNYFTRMRFVHADGTLDLDAKEGPGSAPEGTAPWFDYPRSEADQGIQFLFGHWAAIEGETARPGFHALDTGCVWGGCLTLMRLEDGKRFTTRCDH